MDRQTGRYFYIDHNTRSTHSQPPTLHGPTYAQQAPGVYKTKLKEESNSPSMGGGLKRSHSSPNIAKMMDEEQAPPKPMPQVDRTNKPKPV